MNGGACKDLGRVLAEPPAGIAGKELAISFVEMGVPYSPVAVSPWGGMGDWVGTGGWRAL